MRAFSKTESLSLALRVCLMLFLGSAVRFVHAGAPPVGAYQMSPALKAQIMAHNAAFKLRVERQQNAIMQGMRDAQDAIEIHLDPPPSDSGVHSALNEYLKQMGYVSIPLQRSAQGNQLYVKGSIGKNKQLFLVSTVSPITMVDRKFAQSAKSLGELNAEIDDEVLGHLADEKLLLIPQMVVGGVSFVNQPAAGSQLQLPTINRELDLGCVLGCDFFLRNNCLLDCYAGRLYARVGKLPANSQIDLNVWRG
ncbi:MAG: hypothetical protein NTZ16_02335 [Verrucomicrobia bacterium]|nr:hypothetical protein [Verrucomicrobiota bacterium]